MMSSHGHYEWSTNVAKIRADIVVPHKGEGIWLDIRITIEIAVENRTTAAREIRTTAEVEVVVAFVTKVVV